MSGRKSMQELFWKELVGVYFTFCKEKFNEIPSFDGSAPRDLKIIIKTLRVRAESKSAAWDETTAKRMFTCFLEFAYRDKWLCKNFLLFQLNRQKDKIIFEISKAKKDNQNKPTYQEEVANAVKNYKPISE